jgi:predicted GIY-YIG superfamily endonuclease
MEMPYFVYILTNTWHTVLYTGVTGDLKARILREAAAGIYQPLQRLEAPLL